MADLWLIRLEVLGTSPSWEQSFGVWLACTPPPKPSLLLLLVFVLGVVEVLSTHTVSYVLTIRPPLTTHTATEGVAQARVWYAFSHWKLCPLLKGEDNSELEPNKILSNYNLVKVKAVLQFLGTLGQNVDSILDYLSSFREVSVIPCRNSWQSLLVFWSKSNFWQGRNESPVLYVKNKLLLESCTQDNDCTCKSCLLSSFIRHSTLYQNPTITSPSRRGSEPVALNVSK